MTDKEARKMFDIIHANELSMPPIMRPCPTCLAMGLCPDCDGVGCDECKKEGALKGKCIICKGEGFVYSTLEPLRENTP